MKCVICGKTNYRASDTAKISFFRLPKCWGMQRIWIRELKQFIGRVADRKVDRVCELCFNVEDIDWSGPRPVLSKNAVPVTNKGLHPSNQEMVAEESSFTFDEDDLIIEDPDSFSAISETHIVSEVPAENEEDVHFDRDSPGSSESMVEEWLIEEPNSVHSQSPTQSCALGQLTQQEQRELPSCSFWNEEQLMRTPERKQRHNKKETPTKALMSETFSSEEQLTPRVSKWIRRFDRTRSIAMGSRKIILENRKERKKMQQKIRRLKNKDTTETQPRREENPFSFKHFLNRDTTTTSSSTASSLGSSSNSNLQNNSNATTTSGVAHSNQQFKNSPNNNSNPINGETPESVDLLAGSIPDAIPTSKTSNTVANSSKPVAVPAPLAAPSSGAYQSSTGARPKVPQSILGGQPQPQLPLQSSLSISSLVGEGPKMKRSPRFSSFDSQASLAEFVGGAGTSVSGLNLKTSDNVIGSGLCDDNPGSSVNNFFPNGPDFDRQQYVHRSYSNYDMDGAQSVSPHRSRISPPGGLSSNNHPNSLNLNAPLGRHPGNRQPPAKSYHQNPIGSHIHGNRPVSEYSAALPDFVQDHWMDNWYCSLDMNINSPPNSPISPVDFVEDLNNPNPADICQTLPDFLSDGPIAHSAARLADVAAGLPGLDSPEENSPSLQLSRLRLENERLRRELDESRLALAEQTRRAGELERRLEQVPNETAYSASLAQSMEQVEENLDQSKKRAAAAQSQVSKLKQQVKQLTAEVNSLRRENESLRKDGAVGGDRVTRRPTRTQQLSRDLRRAASTAENNLSSIIAY